MLPIPTFLKAAPAALGVAAIAALLGAASGYALGYRAASASGAAALSKLSLKHATALADASERAREKERALTIVANQLGDQLEAEQNDHARTTQQLKGRIARVTTQYRFAPGAPLQPAPRCVFTHGFASVWNGAIGAAPMPAADFAVGAAGTPDAAEALDSGIRQADVLEHIADYGQRCRGIESQLNRLIDWWNEGGRP